MQEFKWVKLATAKSRFCAEKFIDTALQAVATRQLRVDVLVWDTQDSRHTIPNRDDDQNFARMYFHLLRALMRRRPTDEWRLYPDERPGMDWETLHRALRSVGAWRRYLPGDLLDIDHSEDFFRISEVAPCRSCDTPETQLADLFAGMAAFSRKHSEKFRAFQESISPQQSLFGNSEVPDLSNRELERFKIIPYLDSACKARRLGVSLRSEGYLVTPDPRNPINFWHYQPQHASDRAPTRDQ